MLDTGDWLVAGPPKIHRVEFNPILPAGSAADNLFGELYYRDVTSQYVAVSDVTITFDSEPDAAAGERAALAVFGNGRWRPALSSGRIRVCRRTRCSTLSS